MLYKKYGFTDLPKNSPTLNEMIFLHKSQSTSLTFKAYLASWFMLLVNDFIVSGSIK
jgi:hypothetical protein